MICYTAIFGPYDQLHEPPPDLPESVKLVCFTDQPITSDRWEIRQERKWSNDLSAAKCYKMHPHTIFPRRG